MDLAESVNDGTVDRDQASRILNVVDSRHYHPLVISTEASLLYEVLDLHHRDSGDKDGVSGGCCTVQSGGRRARDARVGG